MELNLSSPNLFSAEMSELGCGVIRDVVGLRKYKGCFGATLLSSLIWAT